MNSATATALLAGLEQGAISSEEIVIGLLDRADRLKRLNVFVHLDPDHVLGQARAIDKRRRSGEPVGPLAGVPVAIKDVLCVEGEPTTCGSRMLRNVPAPLRRHGDQPAQGRPGPSSSARRTWTSSRWARPPRTARTARRSNPWDETRVPGGSSGGSAAAVAADLAPSALGTDTGGSIRQPAAVCGIVGLKPTYGRVSRYGLIAFASSLDQIGPFAHDLADTALLLKVIAGHDPHDSTSVDDAGSRLPRDSRHAPRIAAHRRGPRVLRRGAGPRGRVGHPRGHPGLRDRPVRPSRRSRCLIPGTAFRPITSSLRRSARATWPATTARSTATAPRTSRPGIRARRTWPRWSG